VTFSRLLYEKLKGTFSLQNAQVRPEFLLAGIKFSALLIIIPPTETPLK
jgi:hypothetical protein